MVAFDHRGSFERSLDRIGAASDSAWRAQLKLLIWQAVQQALPHLPARARAAVLIDRGHRRIVSAAIDAAVAVAIALEASGHRTLTPDAEPAALRHDLRTLDGGFGKVLVRWFPDDSALSRRRQLDELRRLDDLVADAGADLLLELLLPPADGEVTASFSALQWEQTVLPGRQLSAVEELLESGVAPRLWKIEGHPDADAADALAELVGSSRSDASILVLGGGADIRDLRRVFSGGAGNERFGGFAVGRSIWWAPVAALCQGQITAAGARQAIGDNFLAVIEVFEAAARISADAAQDGRPAAEMTRRDAEGTRQDAEMTRPAAETTRPAAETTGRDAEGTRRDAEMTR